MCVYGIYTHIYPLLYIFVVYDGHLLLHFSKDELLL